MIASLCRRHADETLSQINLGTLLICMGGPVHELCLDLAKSSVGVSTSGQTRQENEILVI